MAPAVDSAHTSGTTVSSWFATPLTFAPLRANTTADVLVVGGGLVGLTTAYLLDQTGQKVVVLENGEPASGKSSRTMDHLFDAPAEGYTTLKEAFGAEHSSRDFEHLCSNWRRMLRPRCRPTAVTWRSRP